MSAQRECLGPFALAFSPRRANLCAAKCSESTCLFSQGVLLRYALVMGYAILRTQKLKSPVAVRRSMKHAFREQDTPNADPDLTVENTHIGANSVAEGIAAFNAALPPKYRKDAVLAIEYLITASPEDMTGKTREQQDAYFHDALEWLRSKHGADQVVYAGIHRDEKTPHMYAYVVPIDPDSGRLNAKKWLGGAKALNEMQTDFAHQVGRVHGLQRGIEGSKAQHTTVQEFYSAIQAQEHKHGSFTADQVQPEVLEKKLFTKVSESPEMVAARLTKAVQKHYAPAIKEASVARFERRRAEEMANTAKAKDQALKTTQARLKSVESVFDGLADADKHEIAKMAEKLRQERKIEDEKQRRVDVLPSLLRLTVAVRTFAKNALEAIKEKAGNWRLVDWGKVEAESVRESVQDKAQHPKTATEAILKHSPAHADKSPAAVKIILDRVQQNAEKSGIAPASPERSRGPSPGR